MKALVYSNKDKKAQVVTDYLKPTPQDGESLIKIIMAAVCNTDKEILRGYKPDFSGVMGHEFVGIVEQSSDETLIGKRVVGELNQGCGTCLYCKTGREHHCDNRKVIGIANKDGAFAEYMTTATRLLHVVPDEVPTDKAIFCEPLAAALRIAEQIKLSPDKNAAVVGDGRLSFMISQILALSGMEVTVFGRHEDKLEAFKPFAKVQTEVSGNFEIVVDAAGGASGLATAQKLVRRGGTIVLKSTYAGTAEVNMSYFVVNEISIIGSRCGPFAPALRLLQHNRIILPQITLYDLENWENAFNDKQSFKTGFNFKN